MKNFSVLIFCGIIILAALTTFISNVRLDENKLKIGILQLVEHEALDKSRIGFIDGLSELGLIDGKNIIIDYENAQGEQSNCYLLSNKLINKKSDLILAIATPSAQALANTSKNIPILVTAITSPEEAGLVKSNEEPNTNVTGVSDIAPVKEQIKLIKILKPSVKKIGILFSSNEVNSSYQAKLAEQEAKNLGIETHLFTVSQSSEVIEVVQNMIRSIDAIYTPTDNMMASVMPTISSIATPAGIPIVCGETNVVSKGAVGTFGVDYYDLGKLAAKQAYEILINNKSPQNMPIEHSKENKLTLNSDIIEKLKIKIPEELSSIAEFINVKVK